MTFLVLIAALALAEVPSAPLPQSPAPRAEEGVPAIPPAENLNILLLKQRVDELERQTAVAERQYQFAERLLDGVKAKWADAILQHLMTAQGHALIAQGRASRDYYQAQIDALDLRNKILSQHIAMYNAIAILRGIRTIANYYLDPITDPLLGRGRSILPFPEVPTLSPVPAKPAPPPE